MNEMGIESQTLVKNKKTGRIGVVITEHFGCCGHGEVPVVYEGETSFLGTLIKDLEIMGPENAIITDPEKCGMGKGEECCIFLVCDGEFKCARFQDGIRWSIIMNENKMKAKRHPTEMYPNCQLGNK